MKKEWVKKKQRIMQVKMLKLLQTVSAFIKKYYPFRYGKNWDKKHGSIDFALGGHALEEWINYFADDEVDIEAFKKDEDNLDVIITKDE